MKKIRISNNLYEYNKCIHGKELLFMVDSIIRDQNTNDFQ